MIYLYRWIALLIQCISREPLWRYYHPNVLCLINAYKKKKFHYLLECNVLFTIRKDFSKKILCPTAIYCRIPTLKCTKKHNSVWLKLTIYSWDLSSMHMIIQTLNIHVCKYVYMPCNPCGFKRNWIGIT